MRHLRARCDVVIRTVPCVCIGSRKVRPLPASHQPTPLPPSSLLCLCVCACSRATTRRCTQPRVPREGQMTQGWPSCPVPSARTAGAAAQIDPITSDACAPPPTAAQARRPARCTRPDARHRHWGARAWPAARVHRSRLLVEEASLHRLVPSRPDTPAICHSSTDRSRGVLGAREDAVLRDAGT